MTDSFDLSRYFSRIGYDGPVEPTLDVLRRLHLLHPQAIPFENLNPLTGARVALDLPFPTKFALRNRVATADVRASESNIYLQQQTIASATSATYDSLEQRIAELSEAEDLARVRPDLDGNRIMELLGISPGPDVGAAWRFLKELRLERGPLDPADAEQELLRWWSGVPRRGS